MMRSINCYLSGEVVIVSLLFCCAEENIVGWQLFLSAVGMCIFLLCLFACEVCAEKSVESHSDTHVCVSYLFLLSESFSPCPPTFPSLLFSQDSLILQNPWVFTLAVCVPGDTFLFWPVLVGGWLRSSFAIYSISCILGTSDVKESMAMAESAERPEKVDRSMITKNVILVWTH